MVRLLLISFLSVSLLSSCGKNLSRQTNEAIDIALTHLSSGKCQDAIDVLEEVKGGDNPIYLQVLASAYACLGNFDEIHFIDQDLTRINSTTPASILKSVTTLSLSDEVVADSFEYKSILKGVSIVLNSKTHSERELAFGIRKAGDMGVQSLILNIVNFGKFLNFYGNVNSTGEKGQGPGVNSCFINYSDPRARALIGAPTGGCNSFSDGHPDLVPGTIVGKRRLCEGLISFTNILDVLENIDLSNSSSLSVLTAVADKITTYKTTAEAAGLSTLINMTSQKTCETHLNTAAGLLDMEYLYALIYESGLQ